MTNERIDELTEGLRASAVDVKPIKYDFSEGYGERWEYYEGEEVQGGIVVAGGGVERVQDCSYHFRREGDDLVEVEDDDDPAIPEGVRVRITDEQDESYGQEGTISGYRGHDIYEVELEDSFEEFDVDQFETLEKYDEVERFDPDEYVNVEGPMMNYLYPLPDFSWSKANGDGARAAALIAGLPLCVVYMTEEEEYYLALTGGGMDLSREICLAYIELGYLPPVQFTDLPKMAGDRYSEKLIAACIKSNMLVASWAESRIRSIRRNFLQEA